MSTTDRPTWVRFDPALGLRRAYLRLIMQRRPGLRDRQQLPTLAMEADLAADASQLRGYQQICGLPTTGYLPLLYPYVLMGRMHLQLLADPRFPLRAAGMLHLRNAIKRYRAISEQERLHVTCRVARQRVVEKGLEFDIDSEVLAGDQVVWSCVSTLLKRGKFGASAEPDQAAAGSVMSPIERSASELWAEFTVPSDTGRRYARISGDYNLIHISPWGAKLFGFRTAIAHGMWSAARGLAAITESSSSASLELAFKGPIFMGSRVVVCRMLDRFDFYCDDNPRPVIQARRNDAV